MSEFARKVSFFSLFSLLFLMPYSLLFGSGGQQQDLVRADELIDNKYYEEAIMLLSDFTRRNPDYLDESQKRFRRIFQIREEFNSIADVLINTLIEEPENDEKILELTLQLYTLENEDSPLMISFVARTHEIAKFNVNRNKLLEIMARARSQIDAGNNYPALRTYSEGFALMRDEFYAGNFPEVKKNETRQETENILSMLNSFNQASVNIKDLSSDYISAIEQRDIRGILETADEFTPALNDFIDLKYTLDTAVSSFSRTLNEIRAADPDIGDRNHLAFVMVVMNGRSSENGQEGMLGVFDSYWQSIIEPVFNAITVYIDRENNASIAAVNREDFESVYSPSDTINNFIEFSYVLFDKRRAFYELSNRQTITLQGRNILYSDIPQYTEITALKEASNLLYRAAGIGLRQEIDRTSVDRWLEGSITISQAFSAEQRTRAAINELKTEVEEIIANANIVNTELNSYHSVTHITDALGSIQSINNFLTTEEHKSIQRYYNIAHLNFQNSLIARSNELETGRRHIYGDERTGDILTALRYPADAIPVLISMIAAAEIDHNNTNPFILQYHDEPSAFKTVPDIARTNADHLASIRELSAIAAEGRELLEIARNRTAQAEAFSQEGMRLFGEAQAALQRQDFALARDRIERASVRFSDSLNLQESASVRQMRDVQLINFGQTVATAENQLVIADVRVMLNNARNLYFNGNFIQAEDSLVRARNRWHTTNADENEEVVLWLGIVRNALSASSGRVISPTAPLYPEMSQLLSQAHRNYEDGVRFINAGQRQLGLTRFDEARLLTREVKLVFPLNQEAGILDLRIEQFIDPPAFNASFEQRIREAIAGTRQRSVESFADLQNLSAINPNYPNIRAIITQAEIDMGYRPPPPTAAEIARSSELTTSANRILEANQSAQFEVARLQLEEAIALNPENTEASRVRDRLLIRMSIPDTVILTMDDEAEYQRALRELNAGNILVSYAIVERLMQNPRNRNITKVVELQRRILSVL